MSTSGNTRIRGEPTDPGIGPGVAIGAATLNPASRWVVVTTAGNIVGRLIGDTGDVTYALPVGSHNLAFTKVTSATAVGFFAF